MSSAHERKRTTRPNFKSPNEAFEYHILHLGDPEYQKEIRNELKRSERTTGPDSFESNVIRFGLGWRRIEPRKARVPRPGPKRFDPPTVYRILSNLKTPSTFTNLKTKRLNNFLGAPSLREYIDALLTERFIDLDNIDYPEKEYPDNTIPRKDITITYITTPRGKKYIREYKRFYFIHSQLYSRIRDRW